ncbi:efflux RND transporter permease subunit [Treponema sp.]|uniref:efflux RND transporter permease subunit n=1 Tax=Treponema sp. TaxID=166 RepID=UPI003FD82BC0
MKKIYNSSVFAMFVFLIITIIFCIGASGIEFGETNNYKYTVYSIEFNYFGIDAPKMEEMITIPLEEKLGSVNGILDYKSDIQYGKSTTSLYFSKKENSKNIYLAIRDIVDNLYNSLPSDVQKPRIYSSDLNSKSVVCIVFFAQEEKNTLRNWIELNLKKKFESIDGVSEVLISGGSQKEILVEFDSEKSAATLQNPSDFAAIIQDGNSVYSGTKLRHENFENALSFSTKIKSIEDIKNLLVRVSDGYTTLDYFADISLSSKPEEEIVKLNGTKCVSISIKSSSDGNSIFISKECKKILKQFEYTDYKYNILYDTGKSQQKLINSVMLALLESFLCLILLIPLFFSKKRTTILILLLLPVSIMWTLGLLEFSAYSVNQYTIAGLCIALGLIVDPALIVSELSEKSSCKESFLIKLKSVTPSIISASATSVIVLFPLLFLDNIVPGVKNIAIAIIYMVLISMILVIVFFPAFIYSDKSGINKSNSVNAKIERKYVKLTFKLVLFSISKRKLISVLYFLFMLIPVLIFVFMGKSLSLSADSNIIYCSIDYDPDVSNKYIDSEIKPLIEQIKSNECIRFVRSECKKGNVELEIGFDEKYKKKDVLIYLDSLKNYVPEGYFYVPEVNQKFYKKQNSFMIACVGDDNKKCREYAKLAAKNISENNVGKVVLNFKKDESFYEFVPNKVLLAKNELSVQGLARTLRWLMFGPVADKWIKDGKEYDIRIAGKNAKNLSAEKTSNLFVPVPNGSINLNSLGQIIKTSDISKIYRKNGRRAAYFTVETVGLSTDKARVKIEDIFKTIETEKGYGFSFDYEIQRLCRNYTLMFEILLLSIIAIYILLVFLTEDFVKSLKIISIIPVSAVLPLVIKLILNTPLELGDIIGIIILSGISINNAIYISESHFKYTVFKVRNKIKSIVITSLTTVISSIPLYFFSKDNFSKSIAFFMIFGILNSFISSIFMYPAIEKTMLNVKKSCLTYTIL